MAETVVSEVAATEAVVATELEVAATEVMVTAVEEWVAEDTEVAATGVPMVAGGASWGRPLEHTVEILAVEVLAVVAVLDPVEAMLVAAVMEVG